MRGILERFSVKRPKPTRIFFATDLHGSDASYRKFLNAARVYGVDVLVMGGDISGKIVVPIIRQQNGTYRATVHETVECVPDKQALESLKSRLRLLGYYYQVMDEQTCLALQDDSDAVHQLFIKLARKRLQEWVQLAEERLEGTNVKCYISGGNDDCQEVLDVFDNSSNQHVVYAEGKVFTIDQEHCLASLAWSTPTPWDTPRETNEEQMYELIEQAIAGIQDFGYAIFNFHDPPYDSKLDTCPKLDTSTDPPSPIVKAGQLVTYSAGSRAVRRAIEEHQPMLGLHGHIHESRGAVRIGRTLCMNPGSEYGEGVLRGCLVGVRDGEVISYQMTAG
jgi:Icc-related predicted phosphoesterase